MAEPQDPRTVGRRFCWDDDGLVHEIYEHPKHSPGLVTLCDEECLLIAGYVTDDAPTCFECVTIADGTSLSIGAWMGRLR